MSYTYTLIVSDMHVICFRCKYMHINLTFIGQTYNSLNFVGVHVLLCKTWTLHPGAWFPGSR